MSVDTKSAPFLPSKTLDGTEILPVNGAGTLYKTTAASIALLAGGGDGTNGQLLVGQTGAAPDFKTVSGDATMAASGALTVAAGAITAAKMAAAVLPIQRFTFRIQHSDLVAAATSQTIALTDFPANSIPLYGIFEVDTVFSGGGATAVDAEIGVAGDHDELVTSTNVFTGVGTGFKQGGFGVTSGRGAFSAAYSPTATFTSDVDVGDLTAGDCYIHIYYATPTGVT